MSSAEYELLEGRGGQLNEVFTDSIPYVMGQWSFTHQVVLGIQRNYHSSDEDNNYLVRTFNP